MKTAIEIIGNHICITIDGSVDSFTAPSLHDALSKLDVESAETVTLDLSRMQYFPLPGCGNFWFCKPDQRKAQNVPRRKPS